MTTLGSRVVSPYEGLAVCRQLPISLSTRLKYNLKRAACAKPFPWNCSAARKDNHHLTSSRHNRVFQQRKIRELCEVQVQNQALDSHRPASTMSGVWRDRTNLYVLHPQARSSFIALKYPLDLISVCRYISYRQSYAHHPAKKRKTIGPSPNGFSTSGYESEERRGLMSAGAFEDDGDAVIEMDLLPPRWVDIQDEVTELLGTIAKKSADLEKLHQKHVLPGFDDEDVKRQEEIAIERMTQEITRGFHDCQKAIQRIEMMVRDARQQGGVSAAEETMARNIQISLASRVQEVSAGFRKKQSSYLKSKQY